MYSNPYALRGYKSSRIRLLPPTTAAVTMIVSQVASSVDHIVDKSAELCRRASLKWQSNVRRHGMPDEAVHVSPGRAYLLHRL